jgi:hypothetical protein
MYVAASNPSPWVGVFFLIVVLPLWLAGMGTLAYFWVYVAPSALQRWADVEGYQIIQRGNPTYHDWRAFMLDWRALVSNSGHKRVYGRTYRIIVQDKLGLFREGLALVGVPVWYCVSVRRCAVRVRWDEAKHFATVPSQSGHKHPLWDRQLA